ncbi:MAG: hypothetical protein PHH28_03360 [Desulfuromonadaceae bacterium]|nr:hypothetical protein [Desulfuromonadaceae bacterium]
MAAILAYLGSSMAAIFADKILGWIALKAVLVFLFIIVVPLLLNNFLYDIIKIMMDFASSQAGSASQFNGNMTFSGFLAWLLECFRIPEAISLLVSALSLRVVLNMIPFVRLVG